jgi:FSR family fosmidomycin resistance protein-like MFS transporter
MGFTIAILHAVIDFFIQFLTPISPYLMKTYSIQPRSISIIISSIMLVTALSQVLSALLLPRIKNKNQWFFLYGIFCFVVLPTSFFIFKVNIFGLYLIFFTIYLANAFYHPLGTALANQYHNIKTVSLFVSGGNLGVALGSIFITWWVGKFGLNKIIFFNFIIFLILQPSLWSFKKKYVPIVKHSNFSWKSLPVLIPIMIIVGIRTFFMSSLHTYSPIFSNIQGYSLIIGGSLLSLGVAFGIIFNIIGSHIRIRFNNWLVNVITFIGFGLSLVFFMRAQNLIPFVLFYVLSDSFIHLSMTSNIFEAQKILPGHPAFTASITMGLSWAIGFTLHLIYSVFFGNRINFVFYSLVVFSFIMSIIMIAFSCYFGKNVTKL